MVQRRRIQAEYDSIAELRREIRIWGDNGDWKLWSRVSEKRKLHRENSRSLPKGLLESSAEC